MSAAEKTPERAATTPLPPLTNPSDLWHLLGRMLACVVLFWLTIALIFRTSLEKDPKQFPPNLVLTFTTAIISLTFQVMTLKLWRRLRDERTAAEAERTAQLEVAKQASQEKQGQQP